MESLRVASSSSSGPQTTTMITLGSRERMQLSFLSVFWKPDPHFCRAVVSGRPQQKPIPWPGGWPQAPEVVLRSAPRLPARGRCRRLCPAGPWPVAPPSCLPRPPAPPGQPPDPDTHRLTLPRHRPLTSESWERKTDPPAHGPSPRETSTPSAPGEEPSCLPVPQSDAFGSPPRLLWGRCLQRTGHTTHWGPAGAPSGPLWTGDPRTPAVSTADGVGPPASTGTQRVQGRAQTGACPRASREDTRPTCPAGWTWPRGPDRAVAT